MKFLKTLTKPPWRTLVVCVLLLLCAFLGYQVWTPGTHIADGRHDRKMNGIWLQHGWLGDDAWFQMYQKASQPFRNPAAILHLKQQLLTHHITELYPHVAPCLPTGEIARVDAQQTQQFLAVMDEFHVLPWIGGVLDVQVFLESPEWPERFVRSVEDLLMAHPLLAGIHLNIEPMPSGSPAYLALLSTLKHRLPSDKIVSIAAYPPPTIYQRSTDVHWDRQYYEQVAERVDQIVVMMYDTSLRYQKLYQQLMKRWTKEVLEWSGSTAVLLGVPAYDDEGVEYHYPHVENLSNSLSGIHAGLASYSRLPLNYQGVAVYCEWEMEQEEWEQFAQDFLQK